MQRMKRSSLHRAGRTESTRSEIHTQLTLSHASRVRSGGGRVCCSAGRAPTAHSLPGTRCHARARRAPSLSFPASPVGLGATGSEATGKCGDSDDTNVLEGKGHFPYH